jgi:hypothetical protein
MKRIPLFTIFLFPIIFLKAQTSFTIIGGFHNAKVSPNYIANVDTVKKTLKNKLAIECGLVVNFEIGNGLSIRTGFLYSAKGSNWTQFYDTTNLIERIMNGSSRKRNLLFSANTILTTNYIDAPLNLVYSVPIGEKAKFLMGAGPMFSFVYTCYTNINSLSFSQEANAAPRAHMENEFIDLPIGKLPGGVRVFHLGFNGFMGVEYGRVSLNANYSKDINPFFEEQGKNYTHTLFGVTLGFTIPGDDKENDN